MREAGLFASVCEEVMSDVTGVLWAVDQVCDWADRPGGCHGDGRLIGGPPVTRAEGGVTLTSRPQC